MSTPAMAAKPEPMAKTIEMVPLTLMPMSCAASRSSEQARMALPILVFVVNITSATMMITQATIVSTAVALMVSAPSKRLSAGRLMMLENDLGSEPL